MRPIPITTIKPTAPDGKPRLWQAGHPVWQMGFRPFYLLAAVFAALAIPLWLARYLGWATGWATEWPQLDLNWHMHEMVFGMVLAVIIGFLFTAAKNWTELWTPRGTHLAALAGLWLAGRLAMLFASPLLAALIDALFIPLAAWPLYRVLRQSGNTRNLFLIVLLGLLTVANLAFHAARLGWLHIATVAPVQIAILIVVVIESVIGTRVIPMFTRNGAPGVQPIVNPRRDQITLGLLVAASLAWIAGLPALLSATLALLAGAALLYRLFAWRAHRTWRFPLLWILHLSTAWIPVGLVLLALAELDIVSVSAAFHALTVGSMAGLILGMMTRTTLGHTGRMLIAGKIEIAIYVLIQLGAVSRVLAALNGRLMLVGLVLAGVCWSSAFILFALTYGRYLFNARIDGREG